MIFIARLKRVPCFISQHELEQFNNWRELEQSMPLKLALCLALAVSTLPVSQAVAEAPTAKPPRTPLRGPLTSGVYHRVHITSDTVGVNAILPTTIVDSVIEAPICVRSAGRDLTLQGNMLKCDICIEFTEGYLMNNLIQDNVCLGMGTNRPDILRW